MWAMGRQVNYLLVFMNYVKWKIKKWLCKNWKIWKLQKEPMPHVLKNTISDSKIKINYTLKESWAFLFNWHPSELMLSTRVYLHGWTAKTLMIIKYFYWGYSYFSTGIKVIKTGNPFLVLAEILFCYTLKLLSGKTILSYKRQIIRSVIAWQQAAVISTHIWATHVPPTKQIITRLWYACCCNRVEDSMIQGASAALKTAFTHTVGPILWLHLCVTG